MGFEESHSHAPSQWLYEPRDPALRERFHRARSLVLVDDEISTGNTFANLAQACKLNAPNLSYVHLASITDFMGPDRAADLDARFGATVSTGALLYGQWQFLANGTPATATQPAQSSVDLTPCVVDGGFGRLGLSSCLHIASKCIEALARTISASSRVLVLGTGEFMHPAFVMARELKAVTDTQVRVHATTRSPIATWGPIHHAASFPDNYGEGITNYLYNCSAGQYDHILLCHESPPNPELMQAARLIGARALHFHSESEFEENPVH